MNESSNDPRWGSQPVEPFTPDSPGWEVGIRLSPCPPWCDGRHECIANAELSPVGLGLASRSSGDAIHTSLELVIEEETYVYLEQRPESPGGPEVCYVVVDGPAERTRLTPDGAHRVAEALLHLANLAESDR